MRKRDELADPTSCLNKAADDEMVFVIRAKDPCAIATVIAWMNFRIENGINKHEDQKIKDALSWVNIVANDRNGG